MTDDASTTLLPSGRLSPALLAPQHEFVLLLARNSGAQARDLQPLPVPAGPSSLITGRRRRRPHLAPCNPARSKPRIWSGAITFEPLTLRHRPYLLMLVGGTASVRVNGQQAVPVTLLQVKDELLAGGQAYYVSSRRGPSVFEAAALHVGGVCPVCRLPISLDTLLYSCGNCGSLLHCEDERRPEEERLQCAQMVSDCPNCSQPIEFGEGMEWEPEL